MTTAGIRDSISAALEQEAQTGEFRLQLLARLPDLQEKLLLPAEAPVDALMAFVVSYAESVPGSLNLVTAVSKRMGFHDYAAPFLHMAEDYFLRPPEILPGGGGLEALLDEAFLAHRLLEEVNDHHIRHLQRPLLPLDMTEASESGLVEVMRRVREDEPPRPSTRITAGLALPGNLRLDVDLGAQPGAATTRLPGTVGLKAAMASIRAPTFLNHSRQLQPTHL